MPQIQVLIYQDEDRVAPLLEWLDELPEKVQDKCRIKIERLSEMGNELRRPEADLLQEGIYELRVRWQSVNYRILYFFAGQGVAIFHMASPKKKEYLPKKSDVL